MPPEAGTTDPPYVRAGRKGIYVLFDCSGTSVQMTRYDQLPDQVLSMLKKGNHVMLTVTQDSAGTYFMVGDPRQVTKTY